MNKLFFSRIKFILVLSVSLSLNSFFAFGHEGGSNGGGSDGDSKLNCVEAVRIFALGQDLTKDSIDGLLMGSCKFDSKYSDCISTEILGKEDSTASEKAIKKCDEIHFHPNSGLPNAE